MSTAYWSPAWSPLESFSKSSLPNSSTPNQYRPTQYSRGSLIFFREFLCQRKMIYHLAQLKNRLEIKKMSRLQTARRDYEYEARKRLYQECEPILFQFSELYESALRRIYAIDKDILSWKSFTLSRHRFSLVYTFLTFAK